MLGPDEPRYAAIGRAMAQSGDFITPKLWGSPWFEKPPLLYWMTAAGSAAGLNRELSGRLPVAIFSLLFLAACFFLLRREFGIEAAAVSAALLATSAGWITYSELCLTDLPLAVFFSLAALLALPLLRDKPHTVHLAWRFLAIGCCLGLASLAKGLVPVALALPFLWFLRQYWRNWWIAILAAALVALPWYLAVYLRNGFPFIQDFFLKQHFERLYSASLQHVQPWYYYFPVLLAGLFPWTPLLALFALRDNSWDTRRRFLSTLCVFGLLIFSVILNKLPGYLLPLFPSLFVLLGAQFEHRRLIDVSRYWLLPSALLIALVPLLAPALPASLAAGRFSLNTLTVTNRAEWFFILAPLAIIVLARRSWVGVLLVLCIVFDGIYLKQIAYPILDNDVSARVLWRKTKDLPGRLCDGGTNRNWIYGLSFYREAAIPFCSEGQFDFVIRSRNHQPPVIEPLK